MVTDLMAVIISIKGELRSFLLSSSNSSMEPMLSGRKVSFVPTVPEGSILSHRKKQNPIRLQAYKLSTGGLETRQSLNEMSNHDEEAWDVLSAGDFEG